MASFHCPCHEQRLLLSTFLTPEQFEPRRLLGFQLGEEKPNQPGAGEETAWKRAAREGKATGLRARSAQPLPGAAGEQSRHQ